MFGKRELLVSLKDNWFTDIFPTYSSYLGVKWSNILYSYFGYIVGSIILFGLSKWIFNLAGILEIFFYRRKQLDYYK